MRRGALTFASFLLTATAATEARADDRVDNQYQTWFAAFVHGSIYKTFWFWTDAHVRLYDNFEPSALLLRPGLTWNAVPGLFLTAGYAWTPSWQRPSGELRYTDEHRAWEQIIWAPKDETTGVAAMLRGRLEQRFRPADGDDTGLRLRIFARGQVPVTENRRVIFVIWQEAFIGLNETDWGQRPGLDQNRLFIGMGWQAKPKVARLELGYTNVWLNRPGPDPVNHIVALNTFWGWPTRSGR